MVNPAAQTHCRCQSPDQSTAGKRHGRSAAHMASIAWLLIATSSITSLEIDMPHLLLIHCSDGTPPSGSEGPAARPQLPTFGYSWERASEIRTETEFVGGCA